MNTSRTPLVSKPANYRHHTTLDLKDDRRAAVLVQVIFLLAAAGFTAAAVLLDLPLRSGWSTGAVILVTLLTCLGYMWLHEATHGLLLTALSGSRSHYAVRLPYLTTGNDAFVSRRAFLLSALGPLVLWGAVFLAAFALMPTDAFFTLYILSALNVAGSAGDLYQAARVLRLPATALIRDDGRTTTVLVPDRRRWTDGVADLDPAGGAPRRTSGQGHSPVKREVSICPCGRTCRTAVRWLLRSSPGPSTR